MTTENRTHDIDAIDLAEFDDDFAAAEVEARARPRREVPSDHREGGTDPGQKWAPDAQVDPPHPERTLRHRCLFRHNMIVTPENMKWLKTDLHSCGLELERLSDFPATWSSSWT